MGIPRDEFLQVQDECWNYAPPPEAVVFESRPDEAAALLRDPRYKPIPYDEGNPSKPPIAAMRHPCHERYVQLVTGHALESERAFGFIGGRLTLDGSELLVVMELTKNRDSSLFMLFAVLNTRATTDTPAAFLAIEDPAGSPYWGGNPVFPLTKMLKRRTLRIFSGQHDPKNAARFMIGFEGFMDGRPERGYLDCTLVDSQSFDIKAVFESQPQDTASPLDVHELFEAIRPYVTNQDWSGLEARYREYCEQLAGLNATEAIEDMDIGDYQVGLESAFARTAELAKAGGKPAVYVEFDPANHWSTFFSPCIDSDNIGALIDSVIGQPGHVEGPECASFAIFGFTTSNRDAEDVGRTVYLAARTIAALGRAAQAITQQGLAVYLNTHDADWCFRLTPRG